jgi:hypothetical protein
MGKSAPTPPPAPDPTVVAGAEAQANADTARLQANLNNVNQVTPYGSVTYAQTSPDRWTQTTTLSPAEQGVFDSEIGAQQGALDLAGQQIPRIGAALGSGVTPGGIISTPSWTGAQFNFDAGPQVQTGIANTPVRTSFDTGPAVQTSVGPTDFNQAVGDTIQSQYGAAMGLLNPQIQQQTEQEMARLTAQGLNPNDAAWQNDMTLFGNQIGTERAQAANDAVQSGNAEQAQLFGEALNRGNFANTAQNQIYGENQGAAQFANTAAGQAFGQGAQQGAFANSAAGQIYGQNQGAGAFYNNAANQDFQTRLAASQFGNQAEQQGFQQDAYAQELPINELDALLSSGQVGMPSGVQYSPVQVAPTNVLGAYDLNQQAQQAAYQAKLANSHSALGGLFSLGSALLL